MTDKMREALDRLTTAANKLLDDMRERAIIRGDFDTEDGRKIAILDCGSSVLYGLDAAIEIARAALAEQPPEECVAYVAGALAMREKIARCVAMNPRKIIYDIAVDIRENIGPPSSEQAKQWDEDARALIRRQDVQS